MRNWIVTSSALLGSALCFLVLSRSTHGAEAQKSGSLFTPIASVLQSPRCMNCHPAGNAPLQTDASTPHAQSVTRDIEKVGMKCETCHPAAATKGYPLPPGLDGWRMPPAATPMVFEKKSEHDLCMQLKDVQKTGGRDLPGLLEHVQHDPLVLYGWNPGTGRTVPPLTHDAFVAAVRTWIDAGAPCPAS